VSFGTVNFGCSQQWTEQKNADHRLKIMDTSNVKLHTAQARFKNDERREAFTLIELLITISILVLLAGLSLPALTRAKAQAHSAVCKNNLRQLQLGWRAYAEANDDKLVPNLTRSTIHYDIEHRESLYGSWVLGNAQTDTTTENIQKGLLFAHTPSALVYRCPSDRSTVTDHKRIRRTRSYSMNFFLSAEQSCVPLPSADRGGRLYLLSLDERRQIETKARLSQLSSPASVFVFLDVHERSIDSGGFNLYPALEQWQHLPAGRHSQGCNLSFADGHVEHYRWQNPKFFRSSPQSIANDLELLDFKRLAAGLPSKP